MKLGVIIVCRYGSTRLPGKILKEINGTPILQYIYNKFLHILPADSIVIATSNDPSDDILHQYCEENNIHCFRGDLNNVADRFLSTAKEHEFEYAVRINGDNLFIDITSFLHMLDVCRSNQFDFVTNVPGRTFPFGMSIEMVKTEFYQSLMADIAQDERYKEHVTLYLYDHPEIGTRYHYTNTSCPELTGVQLAIDTQDDFDKAKEIMNRLGDDYYNFGLKYFNTIYQQIEVYE